MASLPLPFSTYMPLGHRSFLCFRHRIPFSKLSRCSLNQDSPTQNYCLCLWTILSSNHIYSEETLVSKCPLLPFPQLKSYLSINTNVKPHPRHTAFPAPDFQEGGKSGYNPVNLAPIPCEFQNGLLNRWLMSKGTKKCWWLRGYEDPHIQVIIFLGTTQFKTNPSWVPLMVHIGHCTKCDGEFQTK